MFSSALPVRAAGFVSALVCSSAVLPAQLGSPSPTAALGGIHQIDAEFEISNAQLTRVDGLLGVARDVNGHYWVSARRAPRLPLTNPHMLYELDSSGRFVGGYPQPSSVNDKSAWGLRDLAYDGARYLYGGYEGGRVLAFDTVTKVFDPSQDFIVPADLTFSVLRALAYDPSGDGGNGSMWAANFSSDHAEFSRNGTLLRVIPNMQRGTYGAAFDPVQRTVWWFGQEDPARADIGVTATEMDVATGLPTGKRTFGDTSVFGSVLTGGFAGGAEFYEEGDRAVLLLMGQGFSDTIVELGGRFERVDGPGGRVGIEGGACYVGNSTFAVNLTQGLGLVGFLLVGIGGADLDLAPLGVFAPGSRLAVDTTRFDFLLGGFPIVGGAATVPLPIPNDPALAGIDLYMQWVSDSGSLLATSTGGAVRLNF